MERPPLARGSEQRYEVGNEHYSDSPETEENGGGEEGKREGIKWQLRDGMGNGKVERLSLARSLA